MIVSVENLQLAVTISEKETVLVKVDKAVILPVNLILYVPAWLFEFVYHVISFVVWLKIIKLVEVPVVATVIE